MRLQPFFPALLFLPELHFARAVAAVLAEIAELFLHRGDRLARDDAPLRLCLDGLRELLFRQKLFESLDGLPTLAFEVFFRNDARERGHHFIHDQDLQLFHLRLALPRELIGERRISLRHGFQPIIKIADQFAERHLRLDQQILADVLYFRDLYVEYRLHADDRGSDIAAA